MLGAGFVFDFQQEMLFNKNDPLCIILKKEKRKEATMRRLKQFFSAYLSSILRSAWGLIRESGKTLTRESRPPKGVLPEVALHASIRALRIPGVQSFHKVTIGRNGHSLKVSLHAETMSDNKKRIRGRVRVKLRQLGIVHPMITVCRGEGGKNCKMGVP